MKKVYIKSALGEGWSQFMKRPWYLFGLTLATAGLFAATSSQSAIATALAYIVYGGYLTMLFKHFDGATITFDDLFSIDNRWISFAFLAIVKGVFILLGLLCFIVPGVYLIIRWLFAEYYVIDKGMRPLEALRASSALTEGVRGALFWYVLVSGLLVIAGFLFFIVGAIVAAIIVTFATIKIYKDLQVIDVPTE